MKTRGRSLVLVCLGILLASATSGCAATSRDPAEGVVMCPKCETVWIQAPDPQDLYGLTYRAEQATRCPDCHSAVATFFQTGELAHSCDTCGGELVHCTLHR